MLLQSLTAFLLVSSVAARPIEESSSSVVEPLPIVDSSAAEPIPIVELSSAEDAVSGDRVKLKKLGVGATQCHGSGAFMSRDDVAKGITRFCEEKDGWLTPKNFAPGVWLNVMNLRISNGKEGYLHIGYQNTHGSDDGWRVVKGECYAWMHEILNNCMGANGYTRGGQYLTTSGHVYLDPNGDWWEV